MIRVVEALNYRCLRFIRQDVRPFQVLVGPNASGKSTFLDVVRLLGDLLKHGVMAVRDRAPDLTSLVWMGKGGRFELAVEVELPEARRKQTTANGHRRARYEVAIGLDDRGELAILGETLWLKPEDARQANAEPQRELFPSPPPPPGSLLLPERKQTPSGWKKVVTKKEGGNDYFLSETTGWNNPFRLGAQKLALANLPEDEERFPAAIWVKRLLMEGIQRLALNSEAMSRPAAPGSALDFQPDGSNLPWAVEALRANPERFDQWVAHIRTALPDVEGIDTVVREEDRHRYLRLVYNTHLQVPSWALSDGTLRLLALTLLAYAPSRERIYLVEEPENGIHPQAVETVFQSLSSAYDSQVLCASHSPVVLALAEPAQVLCFARTEEGATDIVSGSEHPNLRDWRRETDLGTLFATGVLG